MRWLLALVLIAAIVIAAVFLADHPGRVEIVWQGWQINTSAAVGAYSSGRKVARSFR